MKAMNFNSCLYKARVTHHRLSPKKHHFYYDIFMFYLDLEELDIVCKKLRLLSRNRFNLFNFRDKDHLQLPRENPDQSKSVREHITTYLMHNGVNIGNGRIMILTNLCTLGYQFNPVSFYYCYDENENPVCAVAEVGNTFLEMKPYFLGTKTFDENAFKLNTPKEFYVSPFIELNTRFSFKLAVPGDLLNVEIDDYDINGKRFFLSALKGKRAELSDKNMLLYFLSFPFITLKIIFLIHWQALILWAKQFSYIRKDENLILQKGVYRPHKF